MWALVVFTIATTGPAASTVTAFIAERQLESLTECIVSEGLVRYEVVATCDQVSEESKKKRPFLPSDRPTASRQSNTNILKCSTRFTRHRRFNRGEGNVRFHKRTY